MAELESRFELILLMDFYGPLLTEHRREVVRLYCEEDLSLGEIAEQLGITRQGVSDALQKAKKQLADYEHKLGLAERYRRVGDEAERCLEALQHIQVEGENLARLKEARQALETILQIER